MNVFCTVASGRGCTFLTHGLDALAFFASQSSTLHLLAATSHFEIQIFVISCFSKSRLIPDSQNTNGNPVLVVFYVLIFQIYFFVGLEPAQLLHQL